MKELKDLTREELKELYEKNSEFQNYAYERAYEQSMFCQEEEARNMNTKVFDIHNHYNSFYLSTPIIYGAKEPEKVAHNLEADYMLEENRKLYEELNKMTDEWENMTTDEQDEHEEIYEKMIEICDKLADGLTEQLRAYEDLEEEYVLEELYEEVELGCYDNFKVDENGIVYENITKNYK